MERIKQILNYGFFGLMTTVVNYAVFYLFLDVFSAAYQVANAVALIVSVAFAFAVNKQFVFASKSWSKEVLKKELPAFLSARAASGLIDLGSMWLLVDALAVTPKLAKILVNVLIVTLNYVFSKIYVFRKFAKR
jgi:putative flippase GtrA